MRRFPASIISSAKITPASTAASGIWTLPEVVNARDTNIWPTTAVATITFTDTATILTNTNAYTFSGKSFGTASSDRYIIVGIQGGINTTGGQTISSVTIGGVTATLVVQLQTSITNVSVRSALFIAAVPTGTTGDVVVTWAGTMLHCGIGIFAVTGLQSSTPTATATSGAQPGNVSINCARDGFIVANTGAYDATPGAGLSTWTNLTERYDAQMESLGAVTGASDNFSTTQTGLSITCTNAISVDALAMVAAAFR